MGPRTIPTPMLDCLREAETLAVVTHENPDGDALGSMLGFSLSMASLGKKVTPMTSEPVPQSLAFLPQSETITLYGEHAEDTFDALVSLDSATWERTLAPDFLVQHSGRLINLDHHASNPEFGDFAHVDTDSAATGQIVAQLLRQLKVAPTPEAASNLYIAIMTDTGGFRHSNTNHTVLRDCAELVAAGASPYHLNQSFYNTSSLTKLRLRGIALSRIKTYVDGKIIGTALSAEDMRAENGAPEDTEGIVENLQRYERLRIAMFLREDPQGVKMSLRSKEPYDVAAFAETFGGGGHPRAAGARFPEGMPLAEVEQTVISGLEQLLAHG